MFDVVTVPHILISVSIMRMSLLENLFGQHQLTSLEIFFSNENSDGDNPDQNRLSW